MKLFSGDCASRKISWYSVPGSLRRTGAAANGAFSRSSDCSSDNTIHGDTVVGCLPSFTTNRCQKSSAKNGVKGAINYTVHFVENPAPASLPFLCLEAFWSLHDFHGFAGLHNNVHSIFMGKFHCLMFNDRSGDRPDETSLISSGISITPVL